MVISLGSLIILLLIIGILYLLHSPKAPKPTGRFKIGFSEFMLIDKNRPESFTPDTPGPRRIMIKVWYPADPDSSFKPLPVENKYQKEISLAMKKLMNIPQNPLSRFNKKLTNSYEHAPIAADQSAYPVLLFSHGYGFGFDTQNWTSMEELASHGYIVFSISHPYEGLVTVFNDQRKVYCHKGFLKDLKAMQEPSYMEGYVKAFNQLTCSQTINEQKIAMLNLSQKYYSQYKDSITIWKADTTLLLDQMEKNELPELLKTKCNLDKIGIFGHSFGGLIAGEMCMTDHRLKAGVNLDAPQINYQIDKPYTFKTPMLFITSTTNNYSKTLSLNLSGMNRVVDADSQFTNYHLAVANSAHYNFSDMSLGPQLLKYSPMLGKIDGNRMLTIMNKAILTFFNKTLKQEDLDFEKAMKEFSELD